MSLDPQKVADIQGHITMSASTPISLESAAPDASAIPTTQKPVSTSETVVANTAVSCGPATETIKEGSDKGDDAQPPTPIPSSCASTIPIQGLKEHQRQSSEISTATFATASSTGREMRWLSAWKRNQRSNTSAAINTTTPDPTTAHATTGSLLGSSSSTRAQAGLSIAASSIASGSTLCLPTPPASPASSTTPTMLASDASLHAHDSQLDRSLSQVWVLIILGIGQAASRCNHVHD